MLHLVSIISLAIKVCATHDSFPWLYCFQGLSLELNRVLVFWPNWFGSLWFSAELTTLPMRWLPLISKISTAVA